MKVPLSWLKEYVDFSATVEDVRDKLTFSGVEVEGIETVGADYEGVIVGEVRSVVRHPDADKLVVATVFDGTRELQVVCGAPNCAPGIKVPLATLGAVLPCGITIKKAKLRGVDSYGMLCAEDELALSERHEGLMILPGHWAAGTPFSTVAGPKETVLELEITWNRPDCLSIIGIARELAALYGRPLKKPSLELPDSTDDVNHHIKVRIDDPLACPRYTARLLRGVTLGPSPDWMQKRLVLCGVRPINNVVDITNYVMLECGQPLHAFDHALLGEHEIIVRPARAGETMATLDSIERAITPEMLLICDAKRPIAVAGIMGGAGSEIHDRTQDVLLESATFRPASIKSTATRLGLATESSRRFERNVDVNGVEWASRRAAMLMVQHAGATCSRGVVDLYPGLTTERVLHCRFSRTRALLGTNVSDERIVQILAALEIVVAERHPDGASFRIPSFRPDLEIEADLIEEIARMDGLDKVPDVVPQGRIVPGADDSRTRAVATCRANLLGLGLTEIMHYSFLSRPQLDLFSTDDADSRVVLPNPVSADYAVMRNSLIPQLVGTLGHNVSRQVSDAAFFEMGKVFHRHEDGAIGECERVSIGLMGPVGRSSVDRVRKLEGSEVFLWLKGIIKSVCESQHVPALSLVPLSRPYFERGTGVAIVAGGKELGIMGLVTGRIRKEWRIFGPVAVAELEVAPLIAGIFNQPGLKPVPAYPGIARDMAVVVESGVRHEDILNVIGDVAPKELTSTELFDIYTGEVIGSGRKSLAYSLLYRSLERTLTDEEANRYHETIKAAVRSRLGAEIREN